MIKVGWGGGQGGRKVVQEEEMPVAAEGSVEGESDGAHAGGAICS